MAISPYVEISIRKIYRNKIFHDYLLKHSKKRFSSNVENVDFSKIEKYLREIGIKKGDILIVHSSYGAFMKSGLKPSEIVERLISLVGNTGTLVMPVIRRYPESPPESEALTADISDIIFNYDVQKSRIWTGLLSYYLMKKKGSITSRFPLNTMTAYGAEAKEMMKNELKDELPTPNGLNSAWKYCLDRNAWNISLGTDLTNSVTMVHTYEDVQNELKKWPVRNWYRRKKFRIIDGDFYLEKTVLEKYPKWGMLHSAGRTFCKDLLKSGVMKSTEIDGVLIESLKSKPFYSFLENKNQKFPGYPYFLLGKYVKN